MQRVVQYVVDSHADNLLNTWVVWPNKRAGLFFLNLLKTKLNHSSFAPKILTIQDFAIELAELQLLDNLELSMELYNVYQSVTPKDETESFDQFLGWSPMLLRDFDEIDDNLNKASEVFGYLENIKEVDHWSKQLGAANSMMESYMKKWENLTFYYENYQTQLLQKKKGYRGLIYRQAVSKTENFLIKNPDVHLIFAGFNVFTKAEEKVIFDILESERGTALWDVDTYFTTHASNEFGKFFKDIQDKSYYKTHPFLFESSNFNKQKNIQVVAISKNIGQVKYAGNLLKQLIKKDLGCAQTAVVLADENLLEPLLNSLPESVGAVNITMGLPLKQIGLSQLFKHIFKLLITQTNSLNSKQEFYYKDVFSICDLLNSFVELESVKVLQAQIIQKNLVFLSPTSIASLTNSHSGCSLVQHIFSHWSEECILQNCHQIITELRINLLKSNTNNTLRMEYLFHFHEIFNKISSYQTRYPFIANLKTINQIFTESINTQKLSFSGEPLEGLQVMGLLESRNLDFDRVIMLGVNEGFLPAKSNMQTLLPLEVRLAFGLSTYKESDALYAYHFYRLICRPSEVHLLYNSDTNSFGAGEMSRYLLQLQLDSPHQIKKITVGNTSPVVTNPIKSIDKSTELLDVLKLRAQTGFSPTVLTNYILNPFKFYEQFILKVYEEKQVEENVELRTMGDIVHQSLETIYKPYRGKFLNLNMLKVMMNNAESVVRTHFEKNFKGGNFKSGKNLIIYQVVQKFVEKLIDLDREIIEQGKQLRILDLERKLQVQLDFPDFDFPIILKGTVDRIDELDGKTRIVDYKTGKVEQTNLEIIEWDSLREDFKYSKAFQVLFYAYLLDKCDDVQLPVEAGIISFKNLSAGFIPFTVKDKPGKGAIKESQIDATVLKSFESLLLLLLKEIFNPSIPLTEKLSQ